MVEDPRGAAVRRWGELARDLHWEQPFTEVHRAGGTPTEDRWFLGGRLNAAHNCLDRHLAERADVVAMLWEGEPGDRRQVTYGELHEEVCAVADGLQAMGVVPGDRVALHLGWIPEAVVMMLACARIGAVHVVIPVPLPSDAVADRLADVSPKVVVTQDGAWRHGAVLPLKARADEALAAVDGIEHTVVVRRTGIDVTWYEGDRWYHEMVAVPRPGQARPRPPAEAFPADHPLLVVHLSGHRGRPRAITHRTGGLLVTSAAVQGTALDVAPVLRPGEQAVLWCPVDIAWSAGQTHGIYGPLLCGATAVMFEGMLDTPTRERAWQIIERYRVTTLLAAPSVWRSLRDWTPVVPPEPIASLRYVVTTGERTDAGTRSWLEEQVAAAEGAVVAEAWGQTELGGTALFRPPCAAPLPDLGLDVVDEAGTAVAVGRTGELVVRHPWPTLPLLDTDADADAGWWHHPRAYATSDLAQRQEDGVIRVLGRLDPMVNASAQLVSATEVRDAIVEHPYVVAAEVVERADPGGGESIVAFVVVTPGTPADERVAADIRASVREVLGGLATPHVVAFCTGWDGLGSGGEVPRPVLRRALWRIAAGTLEQVLMIEEDAVRAALGTAAAELG